MAGSQVNDAQRRYYPFLSLYELEMLGRELGLISGGIVGRKPAERQKLQNVDPVRLLRALPPSPQ